jgi:hypothetical protein
MFRREQSRSVTRNLSGNRLPADQLCGNTINGQPSLSLSPPHFKRINYAVISLNTRISNLNSEDRGSGLSRNFIYLPMCALILIFTVARI